MQIKVYKIIFALLFFLHLKCYSQKISPDFLQISNDTLLSFEEKDLQFQNLLNKHKQQQHIDFLLGDSYEIIKWYWKEKKRNKAIILNKENLETMDSLNFSNKTFYRRNLYSLGYYQVKNFDSESALTSFKKLLSYQSPDKYATQGAFQMAIIYFNRGEYYLSRDHYQLSKTIAEILYDSVYIVKNSIGLAEANKLINSSKSLREGIDILTEVIAFADSVNNDPLSKTKIKTYYFHSMYQQLGNLYIDRADYDFINGKINLEKALNIALEMNSSKRLNKTYNDIGVLYLKDEREDAKFYFEKALEHKPDLFMESLIHRNLSIHHLNFNNYDRSFSHIQNSIKKLVEFDTTNVNNLPLRKDLIHSDAKFQLISALIDKANIWIKLGDENPDNTEALTNAIITLELADFLVDQTRLDNTDQRAKLFWRKTASEIYLKATKSCYLLDDVKKAFYFIEKNKALLLLEDISLKTNKTNSDIPEAITQQEQDLRHNITTLEKMSDQKNSDDIQSQLLLARDNYNRFINSLNANYKFYFKTLQPAKVINFEAFKNEYLTDRNAYLEYILDDEDGYGILITDSNTILFDINNCNELKDLAIEYRNLIDIPFKENASIERFNSVSNKIYNTLFPDEIRPLIKDKVLTIAPDYYLQNIPFEALSTSNKELNYLINDHQINYSYSFSFLSENKKIKRNNSNNIVAFAPIDFSSKLTSLPYSKEELNFINNTFSTKSFLNEKATKENFLKQSNNYKIIHIASHANANDSIRPWISFYDSKADLNDLNNLNNKADLVVLSACNTSLGELYKGEGVMSLSRSFFNSGSLTVMPTLWEVNDKASVELLSEFYVNLKAGQSKSLALHNAKLKYLENNTLSQASPYYWSSFILIGDAGPINFNVGIDRIYYYLIGFILLIIIILLFRRKKNTTN